MHKPLLIATGDLILFTSVMAAPAITRQPSPLTNSVSLGAALTNRITATTANPPLSYQWRFKGNPLTDQTNVTLRLAGLQVTDAGGYTCVVTDGGGSAESRPWVVDVDPAFTKITTGPVVGTFPGQGGSGAAWGDYNGDGYPDLFVSVIRGPNLLFTNNGNGTFTRVTSGPLVADNLASSGCAWGDFDNDGTPDLFVSVNGGPINDLLFQGSAAGGYAKVKTGSIVSSGGNGNGCAWGDYDNDGYLDLYVCNSNENNFLFHNNGNGTFTRITTGPLVTNTGNSQGCAWGDYDNDGYLDLFVTRSGGNNLLFHNNRDGSFAAVTKGPVTTDSSGGPCAWGDYDNDGYLDLFATRIPNSLLYHNNGDGTFTKITNGPVVTDTVGFNGGCQWSDFDNDGYLDLFISVIGAQNLFYHNNGDRTFSKIVTGSLVTDGNAIAAAWGDYDNDGFPDLYTTGASVPGHLYRNNGNSNQWLGIQLLGRVSNRSAIGAKVRLKSTLHGQPQWQMREISGGNGLGSQNDLRALFGLADGTNAEVVRIEWPSGTVQELQDVRPGQFLKIFEPSRLEVRPAGAAVNLTLHGGTQVSYLLESSADLQSWKGVLAFTNATQTMEFPGMGLEPGPQFFRVREP